MDAATAQQLVLSLDTALRGPCAVLCAARAAIDALDSTIAGSPAAALVDWAPHAVAVVADAAVHDAAALQFWHWIESGGHRPNVGWDDLADRLLQHQQGRDARHAAGVFYTPSSLADALVQSVGAPDPATPQLIVDPACGAGALLVAAARARRQRGATPAQALDGLYGVDLDPSAVAVARIRLLCAANARTHAGAPLPDVAHGLVTRVQAADALAGDGWLRDATGAHLQADVVLANPPFGNAIEARTVRTQAQHRDWAAAFPHAAQGAYDRCALFVEQALRQLRPGGWLAFYLPRSILDATWAAPLRAWAQSQARLAHVEALPTFPDVGISLVRLVMQRHDTPQQPGTGQGWGHLLSPVGGVLRHVASDWPTLGGLTTVRASMTPAEAYPLREHVVEDAACTPTDDTARLVVSGSLDPWTLLWGIRPTRYLGARYQAPRVPRGALPPNRRAQAAQPGVLVPGLSRWLEAYVDADARCVGAVATLRIAVPTPADPSPPGATWDLWRIAAILNHPFSRAWYRATFASQAMGGGSVPVVRGMLERLPIPPAWCAPWPLPPAADLGGHRTPALPAAPPLLAAAVDIFPHPPTSTVLRDDHALAQTLSAQLTWALAHHDAYGEVASHAAAHARARALLQQMTPANAPALELAMLVMLPTGLLRGLEEGLGSYGRG